MPDERLRAAAVKKMVETLTNMTLVKGDSPAPELDRLFARKVEEFAKEREDSAMREAAGLVCWMCKLGIKIERLKHPVVGFYWHHSSERFEQNGDCEATEIHERLALKGEK